MKRMLAICTLCFSIMLLFAGIASAHVGVLPTESKQGANEKFIVRVPNEKDSPTIKLEVRFPTNDVTISRFESKPGWKYVVTKDATDKITGVTWTPTGDGILKGEFAEFNFQGKVGEKATSLVWKAYQTYQEGTTVEWVGAEGSEKPAAVTKVKAASTSSEGAAVVKKDSSNISLYLSIASLVLGLVAILISLRKRKI